MQKDICGYMELMNLEVDIENQIKDGCEKGKQGICSNPFPCVLCEENKKKSSLSDVEDWHLKYCPLYQSRRNCEGEKYKWPYPACGFCPVRSEPASPKKIESSRRCYNYNPEKDECNKCISRRKRKNKSCYRYYKEPLVFRKEKIRLKRPATIEKIIKVQKNLKNNMKDGFVKLYDGGKK